MASPYHISLISRIVPYGISAPHVVRLRRRLCHVSLCPFADYEDAFRWHIPPAASESACASAATRHPLGERFSGQPPLRGTMIAL
eukprot:385120-Rhodomonas_salina.3